MSQHRRHADDFTDSLNSFQYSRSSNINSDTLYSMSQDSLDEIKRKDSHKSIDPTHSSKHSIILASSSTSGSLMSNGPISFITSTESAPDLNKRIDLFQSEYLKEQYEQNIGFTHLSNKTDTNKENNNPQYTMKNKQLESGISAKVINKIALTSSEEEAIHLDENLKHNVMNVNSKRDSNHNIHNNVSNVNCVSKENMHRSVLESQNSSLSNNMNKETYINDMNDDHKQVNDQLKKFESMLCFLDDQSIQMKEMPQQILEYLSDKYIHSPKNFTERLLTIIEESILNNEDDKNSTSAINLSRLTTEFRNMCKFIEDESTPEWPSSPLSTHACLQQIIGSRTPNKSVNTSVHENRKSLTLPVNTSPLVTPLSGIDVIKRRFFQKISKNNHSGNIDNIINLSSNLSSTESFEQLEAHCKRLFPEEKESFNPLRKSLSVPSLLNMSHIQNVCEQQMAKLSSPHTIIKDCEEKVILSSPNLLDTHLYQSPLAKNLGSSSTKLQLESSYSRKNCQCEKVSYSKTKSRKINKKSDSNKLNNDKVAYDYMTFDPDELEKTLLQDIAEKRKRCLDTARLITEINAAPEIVQGQKSVGMSSVSTNSNESNSLSYDEAQFLKTLISCKDYQSYLEKQKPLFNLLHKTNSVCTPKTTSKTNEDTNLKYDKDCKKECSHVSPNMRSNISNVDLKSCDAYKSPILEKDKENKEKAECIKPKLFVTPGKTPPNKDHKKKKIYFPTMCSPVKKATEKNILKSPHAEGLYRLNYNTIISPVGMYIRGTDMQLIKNVRAKRDGLLLSPMKKNVKTTPNKNLKQTTPSKISKSQEKMSPKINFCQKLGVSQIRKQVNTSETLENASTPISHFVLPKVSYKLPLQVKTIKENNYCPKAGTRVKKLLESAQSKVVIRHQGRINSVKKKESAVTTGDNEILEINYEPEDESIHIEQTASKTNFIQKQKQQKNL